MNNKFLIISTFFCLVLLISCTGNSSSLLDDNTCEAPCWRAIIPGVTNKATARSTLSKMQDVEAKSITEQPIMLPLIEDMIEWNFYGAKEVSGDLAIKNNIVEAISISFKDRISLKEFIKKYGEPEYVFMQLSDGTPPYMPVFLLFPKKGICLVHEPIFLPFQKPNQYKISGDLKIKTTYLIDPLLEHGDLKIGCLRGLPEDQYNLNVQKWSGYRSYHIRE
jgi:hypothetical protein